MSLNDQGTNSINNSNHTEDALNNNGIENAINIQGNYIKQDLPNENNENTYLNYNPSTIFYNNTQNYISNYENNEEFILDDNNILVNRQNRRTSQNFIKTLIINEIKDIDKFPIKECSICLQTFKNGDKFIPLPCIHIFHSECIYSLYFFEYSQIHKLKKYIL